MKTVTSTTHLKGNGYTDLHTPGYFKTKEYILSTCKDKKLLEQTKEVILEQEQLHTSQCPDIRCPLKP